MHEAKMSTFCAFCFIILLRIPAMYAAKEQQNLQLLDILACNSLKGELSKIIYGIHP